MKVSGLTVLILKSGLNSLPYNETTVYDHEISLPNCPTFRCRFIAVRVHEDVVHYICRLHLDNWKSIFFFKTSSIWFSTPIQLPLFNAICPRCLNRVSGRLMRIGEEETEHHKLFSFDLKVVFAKWNLLKTYRVDYSLRAYILGMTELSFRISRMKFF